MQTNHHDTGRVAAGLELGIGVAEQGDQFVVDDFHDLLAWLHAGQHLFTEGFLLHAGQKLLGHLEIDICFQQRHAHFTEGLGNIVLRDLAQPAQVFKRALQFAAQRIKHGRAR